MKDVSYDDNGVPILSRTDIEIRTEHLLSVLEPSCLSTPRYTPIANIASYLKEKHGLKLILDQNLGTRNGRKIRGIFHIPSKSIYLDGDLEKGEPRFNFTLAHEIGHFVMHRHIKPVVLGKADNSTIEDNDRDLILDQLQSDNPRTWIEWQANKFASSLLLPRSTVINAVTKKQKDLGISRNLGKVYLDRQASSYTDYREIMDYLVSVYIVSKAAVRIRLRELNVLAEATIIKNFSHGPEHISHHIGQLFDSWLYQIKGDH